MLSQHRTSSCHFHTQRLFYVDDYVRALALKRGVVEHRYIESAGSDRAADQDRLCSVSEVTATRCSYKLNRTDETLQRKLKCNFEYYESALMELRTYTHTHTHTHTRCSFQPNKKAKSFSYSCHEYLALICFPEVDGSVILWEPPSIRLPEACFDVRIKRTTSRVLWLSSGCCGC